MSELEIISARIRQWYHKNKRDLPWRNTSDPYLIWLSEIILQQTQVKQGLPYFEKFKTNYPELEDLASADEARVLRDWQGLGYYSRARNLLSAARQIKEERKGKFPDSYDEILKLKGVGPYTAAAIASFAFGEAKAVVDGNVMRVISRLFCIEEPVNESAGQKLVQKYAEEILDPEHPDTHNQAIMELGALICSPVSPSCNICPLENLCQAGIENRQSEFPVKTKKLKKRNRFFYYLVAADGNQILMKKRTEKDIWLNLYDFPLMEFNHEVEEDLLANEALLESFLQKGFEIERIEGFQKHLLSHQSIWAKFLILQRKEDGDPFKFFENEGFQVFSIEESKDLGKPVLILNFLNKYIY